MPDNKINCWEYKKCGRQPGGENAERDGICSVSTDKSFEGINSGKRGGRFCWAIAGTFCHSSVTGTFAKEYKKEGDTCRDCDFFQLVRAEEGTANLRTKFLRFVPMDGKSSLLDKMTRKEIKSGERFLIQGQSGDSAFLIQRGACLVIVEKDGELYPVDHRSEGDIVDMMALFTGEPRAAHVEAETDMEIWEISSDILKDISTDDPDLLDFLSEMVADRFDSKRPTAQRTIGKYTATGIVGRGGYSIIYQGTHNELGMKVAIKMMRHNLALEPEFQENFSNEAKIVASFNHPNIVKIYDFEHRFKTLFIIMEFIEGEALKEKLKGEVKLTPEKTADYLVQICSGLHYAHLKGIIHRDMNPANVFVQPDEVLRVIDFGLACPIGIEDIDSLGTLAYVAPEQTDADIVDQRTDIYSTGITAYEMVTGELPFPDATPAELIKNHLNKVEIPDPALKVSDIPAPLRKFIIKSCKQNPEDRYDNMEEAINELSPLVQKSRIAITPPEAELKNRAEVSFYFDDKKKPELLKIMNDLKQKTGILGIDIDIKGLE